MFWFFFNPLFWIIVGPFFLFAAWCSARVKSTFIRYQQVGVRSGMTGAQAAAAVARAGGANVRIERVGGFLSDHYDPKARTLRLSPEVYDGRSIASIAVAAHEAGHAIQHEQAYAFLTLRSNLVPLTIIGSQAWVPLFVIGMLLGGAGSVLGSTFALAGIGLFSLTVLFQLVTLPVEFDASNRAKAVLASTGIVANEAEADGVRKVLGAAAMTYVAGALVAIAQLIFFILQYLSRRD